MQRFAAHSPWPRRPARCEANSKSRRAVDVKSISRLPRLAASRFESLHAFQKISESNLRFEACERRAEAGMDAVAERQVRVGVARHVEAAGVAELAGVAVRGADDREYEFPGRDSL